MDCDIGRAATPCTVKIKICPFRTARGSHPARTLASVVVKCCGELVWGIGAMVTGVTGTAATADGPPGRADADGAGRPAAGRRPARRLLVGGAWAGAVIAAFAVYLRLAGTRAVNSDGASQALQGWDMLHGNLLLRGWTTTDVSFFTTEVPQYALIELVHGLSQGVVHIAAAMTYTLVLLFAALLAKGTTTGREAAARIAIGVGIMLAPQLASGTNELLSSPDHIGTSVPLLLILLVLDRVRRPRWWVPVLVAALLAWADLTDSVVLLAGVIPLAVVCAFRVARSRQRLATRWYEIALAGGAVAGFGLAQAAYRIIHAAGGYTQLPLDTRLASASAIFRHNLPIAGQGLLLLPGADFLGLPAGASTLFVALHLVGVAAAAAGIALAVWRFRRRDADLVNQLLVAGIVIDFIAFVVTTNPYNVASARDMAPALPFAAVLAARELAPYFLAARGRAGGRGAPRHGAPRYRGLGAAALGVVMAGYLAGLGLELSTPTAPPQNAQLTAWLESHPLGTGLSGYWAANAVTLTSGSRVAVRSVTIVDGRVVRTVGNLKAVWYDPARSRADFVVLFPGIAGFGGLTDRQAVLATFGKPGRVYHVGQYTILWWPKNLLPDVGVAPLLSLISADRAAGPACRCRPAGRRWAATGPRPR
jgi:hypothetical protein